VRVIIFLRFSFNFFFTSFL